MKKLLYIIVALTLVLSAQAFASKVNNVELNYKDGFTVAVIQIDGAVRFSHQTEVAKDGKPYRVIVDILSATHELGAKNFNFLPNCPVKTIRSSQFSVTPEKVVRLVFDMDSERVYRIDSDRNSVSLYFSDNSTKQFANWSSKSYLLSQKTNKPVEKPAKSDVKVASTPNKAKTAGELNKSIDKDRMLSLAASDTPVKKAEVYGPNVNLAQLNKDVELQKKEKAKAKALAKAEADKKAQAKANALAKAEADKKAQAKADALAKAEADKKAAAKKVKTYASTEPTKKSTPVVKKKVEAPKKVVKKTASVVTKKETKSKKSTSRFRRSPVSNKIKGTMVAQFPKRLVIKYKSKSYRDPFATLIDESKKYNNPVELKVPNVEGLILVGIIQAESKSENRALFEDKDGYGYILKTGDKVRKGYVLRVDETRVYFQIFEYGWSRTVALKLES